MLLVCQKNWCWSLTVVPSILRTLKYIFVTGWEKRQPIFSSFTLIFSQTHDSPLDCENLCIIHWLLLLFVLRFPTVHNNVQPKEDKKTSSPHLASSPLLLQSQHTAHYPLTSPCSCSSCAWSSCEIEPGAALSGSGGRCRQSCQPQSATHGTSVWKSTELTKPLVWKIALRCTATAPPLPYHQVHQDLTPPPTKPVSSLFKKYEGIEPENHI